MTKKATTQEEGVVSQDDEQELDDTIETDETDTTDEEEVVINPNDEYRNALAKRHQEDRKEDLGIEDEDDEEDDDNDSTEATESADSEDSEDEEDKKISKKTDSDDKRKKKIVDKSKETVFTVKIDGEEKEVTQEELIRGYQIEAIARKRYGEATQAKKAAELKEKALNSRIQELDEKARKATETTDKGDVKDPDKGDSELDFTDLVVKIREGSDKDAEEALTQLYKNLAGNKSTTEVESLVDKKLREKEDAAEKQRRLEKKAESEAALEVFKTTFEKDIEKYDRFWDLAIMEDNALENDPDWKGKSFIDRYVEAGERAKKWFAKQEKIETKPAKATRQVVKGRTARAQLKEEEKPRTASQIINEMKKARGQL